MDVTFLTDARAERTRLERELERIKRQLKVVDEVVAAYAHPAEEPPLMNVVTTVTLKRSGGSRTRAPRTLPRGWVAEQMPLVVGWLEDRVNPEFTKGEFASEFGVTSTAADRLVRTLEDRGFVETARMIGERKKAKVFRRIEHGSLVGASPNGAAVRRRS